MKISAFVLILLYFNLSGFTSAEKNAEEGIKVNIINLRNSKGRVLISLFKDGIGYPDQPDKAFRKTSISIKDNQAFFLFTDIPFGNYAIAILHDENDDKQMNKNSLGLPKEGYGFSNNVMGAFGPPAYTRVKFSHKANTFNIVNIKARYK
jgi:uncharacterized protein (DUF2141 family)